MADAPVTFHDLGPEDLRRIANMMDTSADLPFAKWMLQ
jgi:hypothetical protein